MSPHKVSTVLGVRRVPFSNCLSLRAMRCFAQDELLHAFSSGTDRFPRKDEGQAVASSTRLRLTRSRMLSTQCMGKLPVDPGDAGGDGSPAAGAGPRRSQRVWDGDMGCDATAIRVAGFLDSNGRVAMAHTAPCLYQCLVVVVVVDLNDADEVTRSPCDGSDNDQFALRRRSCCSSCCGPRSVWTSPPQARPFDLEGSKSLAWVKKLYRRDCHVK